MDNDKILITSNTLKSKNSINIIYYRGNMSGNLFDEQEYEKPSLIECTEESLDFSCPDNSQYISSL